jgi:hypothetical protein
MHRSRVQAFAVVVLKPSPDTGDLSLIEHAAGTVGGKTMSLDAGQRTNPLTRVEFRRLTDDSVALERSMHGGPSLTGSLLSPVSALGPPRGLGGGGALLPDGEEFRHVTR